MLIVQYLRGNTLFTRENCRDFISKTTQQYQDGSIEEWKKKIRIRSACVLLEVSDMGCFRWKQFRSNKADHIDDSIENLRKHYRAFLNTQNLEEKTITLYDYTLRSLIKSVGVNVATELFDLQPFQIQSMLISLSDRLSLNSRGTIFPIIRMILSYLYISGYIQKDYSGMVITPYYQSSHLKPYINLADEEKLLAVIEEAPLRIKAMMRLAIRLGLRESDICNLKFNQIDWINDQIILVQDKTKAPLCLPLLEDVGNAVMDYIMNERPQSAKDYPYIFVRMQAPYTKLTSMYNFCSKLFDKAEVKTVNRKSRGVHVFRHSLTHKLLLKKVPHQIITDTLGHKSKESDKPYLSMEEHMLRECPLDLSIVGQKYWEEGALCD